MRPPAKPARFETLDGVRAKSGSALSTEAGSEEAKSVRGGNSYAVVEQSAGQVEARKVWPAWTAFQSHPAAAG